MTLCNFLHRGERVSENSLVCKNIKKAEVNHESLLQILKQVQSSQQRNTEGGWTCWSGSRGGHKK